MQGDKILLEGMEFYAYHGVNESEKSQGQRFIVDVEMTADLGRASESDDLEDTVNYSRVFRVVKEIVEGPSRDLIEAVAGEIASRVLEDFAVEQIRVKVSKPDVPLKGANLKGAAVEIVRYRDSGHGGNRD